LNKDTKIEDKYQTETFKNKEANINYANVTKAEDVIEDKDATKTDKQTQLRCNLRS